MRPVMDRPQVMPRGGAGEAAQACGEPATTNLPGQVLPEQVLPGAIRRAT